MDRPGNTVRVNCFEMVRWLGLVASVTVMVTVVAPLAAGVPESAPVLALMARLAGRFVADHV